MTDITYTAGKGMIIRVNEYYRLRSTIGGTCYWDAHNQQQILSLFSPLLASMEYNPSHQQVRASIIQGGKDMLAHSIALPAHQLALTPSMIAELQGCIDQMRRTLAQQHIDSNARELLESFRLPSPRLHPEFYRFYGQSLRPRLVIIWGVERSPDSSLQLLNIDINTHFKSSRLLPLQLFVLRLMRLPAPLQKALLLLVGILAVLLFIYCLL